MLEAKRVQRTDVARGLRALLGLARVKPREPQMLAWYEQGLDFAEALHLARSAEADRFASFDLEFAKQARQLGASPAVVRPV